MAIVGEIKKAREIGKRGGDRYIWAKCVDCGKERWIKHRKNLIDSIRCKNCNRHLRGEKNTRWKGGRHINNGGYVLVYLQPNSPFYSMGFQIGETSTYTLEHRLIMAQSLGRCLKSWEHVHHKNGIKTDNRIENLTLTTRSTHLAEHSRGYRDGYRQGFSDGINTQIADLKKEIRLLQWQLREEVQVGNMPK